MSIHLLVWSHVDEKLPEWRSSHKGRLDFPILPVHIFVKWKYSLSVALNHFLLFIFGTRFLISSLESLAITLIWDCYISWPNENISKLNNLMIEHNIFKYINLSAQTNTFKSKKSRSPHQACRAHLPCGCTTPCSQPDLDIFRPGMNRAIYSIVYVSVNSRSII